MSPEHDQMDEILDALTSDSLTPSELVSLLRDRMTEDEVRETVWRLIDEGRLVVTREGAIAKAS